MINSIDYETERLCRLIKYKKEYLSTIDKDSKHAKILSSEINFLECDILPIVSNHNIYSDSLHKGLNNAISKVSQFPNRPLFKGLIYHVDFGTADCNQLNAVAVVTNHKDAQITLKFMDFIEKKPIITEFVPIEL